MLRVFVDERLAAARAASSTGAGGSTQRRRGGRSLPHPLHRPPEPRHGKCKCKKARDCGDVPGNVVGWREAHYV